MPSMKGLALSLHLVAATLFHLTAAARAAVPENLPAAPSSETPPVPPKDGRGPSAIPVGAAAAMRARLVRLMDTDGDGKVSPGEQRTGAGLVADRIDQFPGLKRRFDRNSDGKLDAAERMELAKGLQMLMRDGPAPGQGPSARPFSENNQSRQDGAGGAIPRAENKRRALKNRRQPATGNGAPEKLSPETAAQIDRLLNETQSRGAQP